MSSLARALRKHAFAYSILAPVIVYLLLFQIYPVLDAVWLGFTNLALTHQGSGKFIGLANYRNLLFSDPEFWSIFRNSLVWVFGSTILQFIVAMPAALLLNQRLRVRGLWRGLLMVPWVTPVVVTGLVWTWIYNGNYGLLNYYLHYFHITNRDILWLSNDVWVWVSLLIVSTWKGFPYTTVLLLAGLQGIPSELYESSQVDGASPIQRFWYVTIPSLLPVIFVVGLLSILTSWTKFEVIWTLTGGGPGYATSILPTYVYTKGFVFFQLGLGSAVATITAVFVILVLVIYLRLFRRTYNWGETYEN